MSSTSSRSRTRSASAKQFEVLRRSDASAQRISIYPDRDPADSDRIEVTEPNDYDYDTPLPTLKLPSAGDRYDDCGDDIPVLFCNSCGNVIEAGRTCRRAICERCWRAWCYHQSQGHASKLEARRRYLSSQGKDAKFHHLTVSFRRSTKFNSKYPLRRGKEIVKELMQEVNISEGYIRYHPFRIRDEYRGSVNGHESGEGDVDWAEIYSLIEETDWEYVKDEYLSWEPHFHVIGLSEFAQLGAVTAQIEQKTGVVIHRITKGQESNVSMYGLEDLCSVSAYTLSHCGLWHDDENDEYRASSWAFGAVSNFEPTDQIKHEVHQQMREVVSDVLGLELPDNECYETVEDEIVEDEPVSTTGPTEEWGPAAENGQNWHGASVGSDGSSQNDGNEVEVVPGYVDEVPERQQTECGGQLLPLSEAETYLSDSEWISEHDAETLEQLRSALSEYREIDSEGPVTPPD